MKTRNKGLIEVEFLEIGIDGAYLIRPQPVTDQRGSFARTWCQFEFERHGLNPRLVQCSSSFNLSAGTLRGLHYQRAPHMEAKLVRCTRGAAWDVIVDLRLHSGTFGQWAAHELTQENGHLVYVPEGVAHGFQTLRDETELFYQISTYFAPEFASGIRWNDPDLAIPWPETDNLIISERDRRHPFFRAIEPITGTIAA